MKKVLILYMHITPSGWYNQLLLANGQIFLITRNTELKCLLKKRKILTTMRMMTKMKMNNPESSNAVLLVNAIGLHHIIPTRNIKR